MGLGARPEARVGPHIDREGVQPLYNILGLVWGSRVRTGGGEAHLTAFRFHKSRSRASARLWLCQEPRELAGSLSARSALAASSSSRSDMVRRGTPRATACTAGTSNACGCGLSRLRYTQYTFSFFSISSLLTTPCLQRSYDALCLCCAHPLVLTNPDAPSLPPLLLFHTISLSYHMYRTAPPPLRARRLIAPPRLLRGEGSGEKQFCWRVLAIQIIYHVSLIAVFWHREA